MAAGKIRIVSDEAFEKLTMDGILKAAPNAKLFQNVKNQVMGGVSFTNSETVKEAEQKKLISEKIMAKDENKTIALDGTEVDISSKNYYTKIQSDLSKFLLETDRANSLLKGSSSEYRAVQKAIKESLALLGKMETPEAEQVNRITKSLDNVTKAAEAYERHKREKRSGSEYEKTRIHLIKEIKNSVGRKYNTLRTESVKYARTAEDAEKRQERIQERKAEMEANQAQIRKFVGNLMNWYEQPKENLQKALASAILTGSMEEYAFKSFEAGKADKVFQMTQEQFDKKITEFVESKKFTTYYESIDKNKLAQDLASQKSVESYMTDFKKAMSTPVQTAEQKPKTIEKENLGINLV